MGLFDKFKGLGDKCVESLCNELVNLHSSDGGELSLGAVAREVLSENDRDYVLIGKVALDNEIKELNSKPHALADGFVLTVKQDDKGLVAWFKKKYNLVKSKVTSKDIANLDKKSIEDLVNELDEQHIMSLGAGGLRGRLDPSTFAYYDVRYPTFKFNSKDDVKEFTVKMANCKRVINSLFCCAGSEKKYEGALIDMGYTYDKKTKTWVDNNSDE